MSDSSEKTPEPEVVLWAEYPGGRDRAAVQSDGRSIYFLVQSEDYAQPKLVWVRNLAPAPLVFSEKDAEANRPPLLPESYCNHPKGLPNLDLESCRIYWFPQGLGATLFEGDQLLALIPPLPPAELPGYSRDCIHPNAVAIPLEDDDHYLGITPYLKDYWEAWATPDRWKAWREKTLGCYQSAFGKAEQVYTTENASWPPIEVAIFQTDHHLVFATLGMGSRSQIGVERELQNFQDHQQIELAFRIPNEIKLDTNELGRCVQWLVGLARYPWYHRTCFLPNQTIEVPEDIQPWLNMETARLIPNSLVDPQNSHPPIQLPPFANQNVNLIWLSDNNQTS